MNEQDRWAIEDPFQLFQQWLQESEASEPNDPNAAALATCTREGRPSVRIVLIKHVDKNGFCFFTNAESQKGTQLADNPFAALCFHWKSLRRQVRAEGGVAELPDSAVDTYFHSRSRNSQIGAAVSAQSRPLTGRGILEAKVRAFGEEHPNEVPRPSYWRGYCLHPERLEFWKDGADRLHDRFLYTPQAADGGEWARTRLYP